MIDDEPPPEEAPLFKSFRKVALPFEVRVTDFRIEPYHPLTGGDIVYEMLANVEGAGDEGNEGFFRRVHEEKKGPEVDRHLFFKAMDFARELGIWPKRKIALNLYPDSLNDRFLLNALSYLKHYDIPNNKLVIEVLEHDDMHPDQSIETLELAASLGLQFALDDVDPRVDQPRIDKYGPVVDYMKIDKAVIRDFKEKKYPGLETDIQKLEKFYNVGIVLEGVTREEAKKYGLRGAGFAQSHRDSGFGSLDP